MRSVVLLQEDVERLSSITASLFPDHCSAEEKVGMRANRWLVIVPRNHQR
jgi:hypothetical protein